MTRFIKVAVAVLFLAGLLLTGALGTETRLLFFWPGCVLLGTAATAGALRWRWRMRTMPTDACLAAALVFAGVFITREITSPVPTWAREDLYIVLGCGAAYLLTATVLSHPYWRAATVVMLLILTAGNLAMGFVHFSGAWSFHLVPHYFRSFGESHRIGGFFINPNHLGAFLAAMTMLSLGMGCFGRGGAVRRLLLLFIALASAIGVALAKSRGGFVGLGVGGLALAVMAITVLRRTHPHMVWKAAMGIVVVGGVCALLLGAVMSEQMSQRLDAEVLKGDPRPLIWKSALAQHAEHPWLGAGARMFFEGCLRLRPVDAPPWMEDALFVHNEWIQALSDYGWAGLAAVVLLFAVHLVNGWRHLRWFADEQFPRTGMLGGSRIGLVIGAMAAIIALLAHAALEFHFHVPAVAVTAAVLLGALANPGNESHLSQPVRLPGVRVLSKLALLGCGVMLLRGAFTVGLGDYFVEKAALAGKQNESEVPDVALLDRALSFDPDNAQTWRSRGLAMTDAAGGKQLDVAKPLMLRAAEDLEHSRELNPFDAFTPLDLADVYFWLGRFADARAQIMESLRMAPLHAEPRHSLAVFFHRQRRWQEAEEAYLWTAEAKAGRTSDAWIEDYKLMLKDAAR